MNFSKTIVFKLSSHRKIPLNGCSAIFFKRRFMSRRSKLGSLKYSKTLFFNCLRRMNFMKGQKESNSKKTFLIENFKLYDIASLLYVTYRMFNDLDQLDL